MNQNIEIKLLTDCEEHIPALAKLWHEEISQHWVPDASIEKAKKRLIAHLNKEAIPMAMVALQDGSPVGMVCLRETDGIRPGVTPWLGSLVVNPKFRGQKVGERLINTVKEKAAELGYQILYLLAFNPTIPNWYEKLGWNRMSDDELFGHRVAVMSISI